MYVHTHSVYVDVIHKIIHIIRYIYTFHFCEYFIFLSNDPILLIWQNHTDINTVTSSRERGCGKLSSSDRERKQVFWGPMNCLISRSFHQIITNYAIIITKDK